ncbi:MAG: ribonuclease III [Alphaproteobacteria bacterium]|nr:MAG: ribonuclease III [Rickettsiaceae bacterium 4572_127]
MKFDIITKKFRDKKLLKLALRHSSLSGKSNERLEFLGDRVLGLVISTLLFEKFPKEPEGDLAKRFAGLVCTETLSKIANDISLIPEINVDADLKRKIKTQTHLHANCVEAILGALYLDSGFDVVSSTIKDLWKIYLDDMIEPPQDAKSRLQELVQKKKKETPTYILIDKKGKEHSPIFKIKVETLDKTAIGEGATKKEAEQNSAEKLLEIL